MNDRALAERADELMNAVCDGRIPTRAELKLKVRDLLAVCANEALERAAQVIEGYKGGYTSSLEGDFLAPDVDGPWGLNSDFARIVRKLKAEG